MLSRPCLLASIYARARIITFPRPVSYADLSPSIPIRKAPVGKSGPFICSIRSSQVASGFSIKCTSPAITSLRLCGGILVAMPTAMPSDPLISRPGTIVGNTVGSLRVSSKFEIQSTVSFSRSCSNSPPSRVMRASVYRMAAALSPSTEPKFPCPSTSS